MIMEAEVPHNLPSTSWRCRKANGKYSAGSKGLRTRNANGVCPSSRAREDQCLSPYRQRESSTALCLFVLLSPSMDWVMPAHSGRSSALLRIPIQMLISSGNTLTGTPRDYIYPAIWVSHGTNWQIKLTIMLTFCNLQSFNHKYSLSASKCQEGD